MAERGLADAIQFDIDSEGNSQIEISFLGLVQIPHNFPQLPAINILEWEYHVQNGKVKASTSGTIQPKPTNR